MIYFDATSYQMWRIIYFETNGIGNKTRSSFDIDKNGSTCKWNRNV